MGTTSRVDGADIRHSATVKLIELAALLDLNREALAELAETMVRTCNADLESLRAAHRAGDESTVIDSAHSIKGAALSFGLADLAAIAESIESQARAGALDRSTASIAELTRHVRALREIDTATIGEG